MKSTQRWGLNMRRTYYLRSRNAYRFSPIDGEGVGMSGLFGNFHKAFSKVFTKVFKPNTLLGKLADPLGLSSRNLKWGQKVADVVGTAAAVVGGGWALGAMAGGAGGFWATAAKGASVFGKGLLAGGKALGGAGKALGVSMLSSGRLGGGGGGAAAPVEAPTIDGQVLSSTSAPLSQMGPGPGFSLPQGMPELPGAGMPGGPVGPPDISAQDASGQGIPSAEVEVTAPADSGPNWALIGLGVAAVGLFFYMNRKKKG